MCGEVCDVNKRKLIAIAIHFHSLVRINIDNLHNIIAFRLFLAVSLFFAHSKILKVLICKSYNLLFCFAECRL